MLGDYEYRLFRLEENELAPFLERRCFHGINVTIPYKKAVVPFCEELSEAARHVGCVNTILCRADGSLFGHNTDYDGFMQLIKNSGLDVRGKKAAVLGTGGASMTVLAVLRDLGADSIISVSRTGENNYENLLRLHSDADILVNATPVGMAPNITESPVLLDGFEKLCAVFDVIYNPSKTALMLQAEKKNIPAYGGLPMLVSQAIAAASVFTGERYNDNLVDIITNKIASETLNIVLTGMPGCGKSSVGRALAELCGRRFFDSDELIEQRSGMSVEEIFALRGEEAFRALEAEAVRELAAGSGAVIALGGGAVLREENRDRIRQNSSVVWLKRELDRLATEGRPLSKANRLEDMYAAREPVYKAVSDIAIDNDSSAAETALKLRGVLGI